MTLVITWKNNNGIHSMSDSSLNFAAPPLETLALKSPEFL